MRVFILITHGNIGGATNFVYWLARGLKKEGFDITVGFGEGEYLKNLLEKEGLDYINFKYLRRTHNPFVNLLFIKELKSFLDKNHFDICHFNSTNTLFGALSAKLSRNKIKTIFTFHGLSILDPNYKKNYLFKLIYWCIFKFLLSFIDVSVFVCRNNLEIAKKIHLVKSGVVIYNGIPEPKFLRREDARMFLAQKLGFGLKDKFVIGSIGRLDYQKNYDFLINNFFEVLKIIPNVIYLIIGEGEERKKYENLIANLNLKNKIFLIGEIPNASQYIKGFDLFVLPSRYEGLSVTLIEAVFAQIPILASDVGGNKEIVGEEHTFNLNNKQDFLEKIKKIKNSEERGSVFKIEEMIKKYLSFYLS